MEYYTIYHGSIITDRDINPEPDIALEIANLPYFKYEYFGEYPPSCINQVINDSEHTWYSCEIDMRYISKKFPDVIIVIEGIGDDRYDVWKSYFKDGKVATYYIKPTFDEFSEEDLR